MNAIDTAMNYSKNIEVDLESNLFKTKSNINKNLIKPKQCRCCLLLFTPEDEEDNFCGKCKEEGFMEEDVKLKDCETEGCTIQVKGKKRFCDKCQDKKQKQRQKDRPYKKRERKKFVKHIDPAGTYSHAKKEISTTDSPFEKLIKGVFFLFENEVESVLFTMKDGEKFLITKIS